MTRERDIERVLQAWLEPGASEMPDRLFDGIVDRIERVPQRRFAWTTMRFTNMISPLKLAAVVAIAIAIVVGTGRLWLSGVPDTGGTGPAPSCAPASSLSSPAGPRVEQIPAGDAADPRWFAADDQSLWVHALTSLVRVDLATSAITAQVPMYMQYGYDATGLGSVWQTDFDSGTLLRIDPATNKVVKTISVGSAPSGVVVTDGAVWVADRHDGTVTRVDPATNTVVATIRVGPAEGGGPQFITAGPDGIWVNDEVEGTVVRIDPATNAVGPVVPLGGSVASDGTQVWVGVDQGPSGKPMVVRVDPVSGKTITEVDLDVSGISPVALGLGSVWVIGDSGLLRIDPATGRILETIDLGGASGDLLVAGCAVWVATNQPYVLRVTPS
jgi:YVTN family beta-propeller protein